MNGLRKLASVRVISELRLIPDADNIETAVVDGWSVVVKKESSLPETRRFISRITQYF